MPPLPSTLDNETLELILSVRRRQTDLSESQIPRLRACRGPLTAQQNLAADLRDDIEAFARQIEALSILVGDQKGERNRRELTQIVEAFRVTLASLRKDARAALLASKRAIDSQGHSLRQDLLSSTAPDISVATEDALMKANDDVTEALRRTIALMQNELERSVLTSQMLDESTASLQSTSTIHDTLNNVMGTSKQLIVALEKSDWLDRILILAGLALFMIVVLFILKQRILDRGLRIAFWWTRFLPKLSNEVGPIRIRGGEILSATASTVLASTLPTLSLLTQNQTPSPSALPDADSKASQLGTLDAIFLEQVSSFSYSTTTFSVPSTPRTTENTSLEGRHTEL